MPFFPRHSRMMQSQPQDTSFPRLRVGIQLLLHAPNRHSFAASASAWNNMVTAYASFSFKTLLRIDAVAGDILGGPCTATQGAHIQRPQQ